MPILTVHCPECRAAVKVSLPTGGKSVECPKCEARFHPKAEDDDAVTTSRSGKSRRDEDEDERKPRRRFPRERERLPNSSASSGLLIVGIIAAVLLLVCGGGVGLFVMAAMRHRPVAAANPPAPVEWQDNNPIPVDPADRPVDKPQKPPVDDGPPPQLPPLPPPEQRPHLVLDPGGHTATVTKVLFLPDSKHVVSVSMDKTIRLWDASNGEPISTYHLPVGPGDEGALFGAAISPNGQWLAVAGVPFGNGKHGCLVHVISVYSGRVAAVLTGHANIITTLAFSRDNQFLATGSHDATARVYAVSNWEFVGELKGHKDAVTCLSFGKDSSLLATASRDTTVRLWNLRNPAANKVIPAHKAAAFALAWAPDGLTLASGSSDGTLNIWSNTGVAVSAFKLEKQAGPTQITSLAYTPDGKRLLYTGIDSSGAAGLVEVATGRRVVEFPSHVNTVMHGSLSPDGKRAVTTGGDDHETYIWNTENGEAEEKLVGTGHGVYGVGWSADGKSIAWGNTNRVDTIHATTPLSSTFRLETLEFGDPPGVDLQRAVLKKDGWAVEKKSLLELRISHDGDPDFILAAPLKDDRIVSASIIPGERLVLGCGQGLYLVNLRTRKVLREFRGHTGMILAVTPSPDGKYFITGSTDETMRIWSPDREDPMLSIFVADTEWIAWTPEGYYAASVYGERLMGWQVNNGVDKLASYYPAIQFRASLYQPAMIRLLLPNGNLQNAFVAAWRERRQKINAVQLGEVIPPQVAIVSPTPVPGGVPANGATVEVKAVANSTGNNPVTAMRLLLDGRPYQGKKGVRWFDKAQVGKAEASWSVIVPPGKHSLMVQAASSVSNGLSEPLEVVAAETGELPTLYIVACGIDAYPGPDRLHYAASDARLLTSTLKAKSAGVFKSVEVHLVLDREATRARVVQELEWLAATMTPRDVGIFSFSGHGTRDEDGNYYLCSIDQPGPDLAQSWIPGNLVHEHLANIPGRLIALFDACHSGTVANDFRTSRPDNLARELVTDECGVIVMCSSQGREYSMESPETRAGFFTFGITEGLRGKADYNHDGFVQLHELDRYAAARVRQLSGGKQNPVTGRPPSVRSFTLSRP
jgi:WD40 repeat protein